MNYNKFTELSSSTPVSYIQFTELPHNYNSSPAVIDTWQ